MAHVKKSVTLDSELVREIEELVGPRGFSAFMNESARIRLLVERGRTAVRDYEVEHGSIPDGDLEAVDRAWPA
jgi:hypothetical protein